MPSTSLPWRLLPPSPLLLPLSSRQARRRRRRRQRHPHHPLPLSAPGAMLPMLFATRSSPTPRARTRCSLRSMARPHPHRRAPQVGLRSLANKALHLQPRLRLQHLQRELNHPRPPTRRRRVEASSCSQCEHLPPAKGTRWEQQSESRLRFCGRRRTCQPAPFWMRLFIGAASSLSSRKQSGAESRGRHHGRGTDLGSGS